MVRINAIIFDLDNVLYDEKDYFTAAYREIAKFLATLCELSEQAIYEKLLMDLQKKTSMYPRLFNDLLSELRLNATLLPEILNIYAHAKPNLRPYAGVKKMLRSLRRKKVKLALITNGCVETQKNKIHLLRLEQYFDVICYAREVAGSAEKPNPEVYRKVLERLGAKAEETLCIGDNPYTDFWGAKKLGMQTLRLLNGEFKGVRLSKEYEADKCVPSVNELISLLLISNF